MKTGDRAVRKSISFLYDMFGEHHPRDFAVRLWDGTVWDAEPGMPVRFTLVLKHPGALRRMFWPPGEISLAEAYIYDDFDIEGGIGAVFPLADDLLSGHRSPSERLRQARQILSLPAERRRPQPGRGASATRKRVIGRPSLTTMTCLASSMRSGWIGGWSTPALTSPPRRRISIRHRSESWITSVASSG